MITYSAGMLKTFLECPIKYGYIFEEHINIPSDDKYTNTGKKIHSLINYFFKKSDIKKMTNALENDKNTELSTLWNNFLSFKTENVIESEYTFNVLLNEKSKLTGRVDAIAQNGENIEILDWKTGSSKNINEATDMQTLVYMYSIYKLFKHLNKVSVPEQLSMSYYFLKEKVIKKVNFSSEKYIKYERIILDTIEKMQKFHSYKIYPSEKCTNCSYKIICKGTYEGLNDML
ncbi:MAG: PD-(D/E)XK nuclease family protein [Candidatus Gastranaerophilaceae bacterium]